VNLNLDPTNQGTNEIPSISDYPIQFIGSLNKSAIHWDMICDMRDGGQISVDNQLFDES